jgi:hypothetical protein
MISMYECYQRRYDLCLALIVGVRCGVMATDESVIPARTLFAASISCRLIAHACSPFALHSSALIMRHAPVAILALTTSVVLKTG